MTNDQHEQAALSYAFDAQQKAANPELIVGIETGDFSNIAIIGGGLMGSGIAVSCLVAGLRVVVVEQDLESVEATITRITSILDRLVERNILTVSARDAQIAMLLVTEEYSACSSASIVIEAVFEELNTKKVVFSRLQHEVSNNAILATNTSYLNPNLIFSDISNQSRCIGFHFFSPAHVMKLLEVIRTSQTSNEAVATGFAFAKHLDKSPVLSGVCDGFIGNRMLAAYRRQADYLLVDGAHVHQIDESMTTFGMPMGPYALQDLTGLQIAWANRKRESATRDPAQRYVAIGDRLCELGHFGQRTGRGWYKYKSGSRQPIRSHETETLIERNSAELGKVRRAISTAEIQESLLCVLVNEGALILEAGVAASETDVDAVQLLGYRFPPTVGGPMYYAKQTGINNLKQHMQRVLEQSPGSWQVSALLA